MEEFTGLRLTKERRNDIPLNSNWLWPVFKIVPDALEECIHDPRVDRIECGIM